MGPPLLIRVSLADADSAAWPLLLGLTLILTATAVAYLRSPDFIRRFVALLGGVLAAVIVVAAPGLASPASDLTDLYALTAGIVVVVASLFSPMLIGLLHRSLDAVRAAQS
ncbi:MAG: hypothetical protein R2856_39865 [Caldilineaceae bacterium]